MLVSVIVNLKSLQNSTLPQTTGPAVHGAFFKWLARVDSELAEKMHNLKSLKPFTVSAIQTDPQQPHESAHNADLVLKTTKKYWFRITSLDQVLSEHLLENFERQAPSSFEILSQSFSIKNLTADYREHPWAAQTSWDKLQSTTGETGKSVKVKLLFHSPTTFKSGGRSLPLPLPEQTFSSLAIRWNTYNPQFPISPDFFTHLAEKVSISAYDLKSEIAFMEGTSRGSKLVCFRGWSEYTSFNAEPVHSATMSLLSRFAFFAGIGYKTTMGFGQALAVIPSNR